MNDNARTCAGCAHARAMPLTLGRAVQCRCNPPQIVLTSQGPGVAFPTVPADDEMVCGQWKAAPPIVPENLD